jgi:hypothetical protein
VRRLRAFANSPMLTYLIGRKSGPSAPAAVVLVQQHDLVDGHLLVSIGDDHELQLEAQRHTGNPQEAEDPPTVPASYAQPEPSASTLSCPPRASRLTEAEGIEKREKIRVLSPASGPTPSTSRCTRRRLARAATVKM